MGAYDFVADLPRFVPLLDIRRIVSLFYFEFSKHYSFPGERHNFWELVYADRGQIEVLATDTTFTLKEGELVFHQPNEFHRLWSNGRVAPNVMIVTFVCESPAMAAFAGKIMTTTPAERAALAAIIKEAYGVYQPQLGMVCHDALRLPEPTLGGEQMIYLTLAQLLITLLRAQDRNVAAKPRDPFLSRQYADATVNQVILYLKQHIDAPITLDVLSAALFLSKSSLKARFKAVTGQSIMGYLKALRIAQAKQYIREQNESFTQIALNLGFDSVRYFSTCFKQATGFTPTQYARSVEQDAAVLAGGEPTRDETATAPRD
ncbi:helix-turn-helix domain-containing protein [Lacticaseibacillus suihuaensis]